MNVDWNNYSEVYDIMAEANPAYQDLLRKFDDFLKTSGWAAGSAIGDFGAGTGNFSVRAAKSIPGLQVQHIDADQGMNARAIAKAGTVPLPIHQADLNEVDFPPQSLDGMICVHALYTLQNPEAFLQRAITWLAPGGRLFLCDLGRQLDLQDWRQYFFRHLYHERGLLRTLALFYRARNVIRQNRNILNQQRSGRYWIHSHSELVSAIKGAGFCVIHSETVYRGYSDLVIAEKPEH